LQTSGQHAQNARQLEYSEETRKLQNLLREQME